LIESDIRVFISSPGDVETERIRAGRVIDRLNAEFEGRIKLTAIRWEEAFYTADKGFQDQITRPSQTDLVVCILWKRLGSELPPEYNRPDGTARTGTEYEFEEALEAALDKEVPYILVYRKTEKILFDSETVEMEQADLRALEAFWQKWFHNEQGHFTAGFHKFETPDQFEAEFEKHLRQWLEVKSGEVVWPIDLKGSPYRGLEAFDEEHAAVFFGRRRAIEQVRARLTASAMRGCAFLLVLGMSGSGKSSLVRAGVIPRLLKPGAVPQYDRWRCCVVRPSEWGEDALLGLAEALFDAEVLPELVQGDARTPEELADDFRAHPDRAVRAVGRALERWAGSIKAKEEFERDVATGLILVVDQFEEIFHLPEKQQSCFIDLLSSLARSRHTWVLAAMRSDKYQAFQAIPKLLALKEAGGMYDLAQPGQAEIREIIQGPAKAAGLSFEHRTETDEDLADVLEKAAASHPGSLPLLEFTLDELFKRRDESKNILLINEYKEVLGGLEGAIETAANAVYEQQSKEVQDELTWLLRSLVSISDEGSIAAKALSIKEGAVSSARKALIEAFVEARLLVSGGDESCREIRVAHEALLTHWTQAKEQIEKDKITLQARSRLAPAAARWQKENRRSDLLLPEGKLLTEATDLVQAFADGLEDVEKAFVKVSQDKARRWQRLKRLAITGLIILTVLTGLAAYWATLQKDIAEQERKRVSRMQADSDYSKGVDFIDKMDINMGVGYLARALINYSEHKSAATYLMFILMYISELNKLLFEIDTGSDVLSAFFSNKGQYILSINGYGGVKVWNAKDYKLLYTLGEGEYINSDVFSKDDNKIAILSAYTANQVRIYCSNSGKEAIPAIEYKNKINSVAFSPDGDSIAIASENEPTRIWDAQIGNKIIQTMDDKEGSKIAIFSPNGNIIVTVSQDGLARIRDIKNKSVWLLNKEGKVEKILFSPDGNKILTLDESGAASVWDVATRSKIASLYHGTRLISASFITDSEKFFTTSFYNKMILIWDVQTGCLVNKIYQDIYVKSIEWSPDGKSILTVSGDNGVRIWDTLTGNPAGYIIRHRNNDPINSAYFSPNSKSIITSFSDNTFRIWDIDKSIIIRNIVSNGFATYASFSPDNSRFIKSHLHEYLVEVINTFTREKIAEIPFEKDVEFAYFLPAGNYFITTSGKDIFIFDAVSCKLLGNKISFDDNVKSVYFNSSEKKIYLILQDNNKLYSLDIDTREIMQITVTPPMDARNIIGISPDGNKIAMRSYNTITIYDSKTWLRFGKEMVHLHMVKDSIFSRDGNRLMTLTTNNVVHIWDAISGNLLTAPISNNEAVDVMAFIFSPDGKRIVIGFGNCIRFWDSKTGKAISPIFNYDSLIISLSFSADGKLLLVNCADEQYILTVPPSEEYPVPSWLPNMAQTTYGFQLNSRNEMESIDRKRQIQLMQQIVEKSNRSSPYFTLMRWIIKPINERTDFPYNNTKGGQIQKRNKDDDKN